MRTVLRLVLAVLGLVLCAVGVTAAVVVGSDDTVFNEPAAIDTGRTPLATVPDLFSYRDLDLTVRASSPDGVFLATGSSVDIADYLDGRAFYEVEEVTRSGLRGEALDVDREPVEVAPEKATFWTTTEQGKGTRSLSLTIDGQADRVVVAPLGEGPVTLSFGVTIDGLFELAAAVAVVGMVLLLLAVFLVIRARRRRAMSPQPVDQPTRADAAPLARVAALALVVALAGCGSLPEKVAYERPTKVALTESEVPAMLADYDKRNYEANRAADAPRYDSSRWQMADTGVLLDAELFNTFSASVFKSKDRSLRFERKGNGLLAAEFDAYPMWAIVPTEARAAGEKQTPDQRREDEKYVTASLFTREAAAADWKLATSVDVEAADMPEPLAEPDAATREDIGAAREAVAALRRSVETRELALVPARMRRSMREVAADDERLDYIARAFFTTAPLADESQRLFVLPVKGGVLAISSFALRYHEMTTSTSTAHWVPPYDDLRTGGSGEELVTSFIATAATYVPSSGQPRVLGMAAREILTSSANGVPAVR